MPQVWRLRGHRARADGDDAAAETAWQRAAAMFRDHQREPDAMWRHGRRAELQLRRGDPEVALQSVNEVLAKAAADSPPRHRALIPSALVACHAVRKARGDGRADALLEDLAARLDEQLAILPSAAERQRLKTQVPHRREVVRLPSLTGKAPAET